MVKLGAIGQIARPVSDIEKAVEFYRDVLGLPHLYTFGDLAFFDMDGTRLYLHRKDEADWQPGSILYFVVDDIDAAWEELGRRGVDQAEPPHRIHVHADTGIEEWMAFFADGEGNTLALMAQMTARPEG